MHPFLQSAVMLVLVLLAARYIKRSSGLLQRFFIPSALVAGAAGLLLGPQIMGAISSDVTDYWASWPKYLISVVFAGLFLGKTIPSWRDVWKLSGPMIAFGNTLAWGQYVLGILATLLILSPFFGVNPIAGALIEIGFEGGHGTAAGLAPTFEQLGWSEGTDIALGLATVSIVAAVFTGILLVNIHNRRRGVATDTEAQERQRRQMIRSGYNLISLGEKLHASPRQLLVTATGFAAAILVGWLMLKGMVWAEDMLLAGATDIRFFAHLPLFPLAMLGGLLVQVMLRRFGWGSLMHRRTAEVISSIALDVLIATAIATVSLRAINDNLAAFLVLAVLGYAWIIFGFLVLAPRMFSSFWFERGLTNMGQSMGMTATGLLLGRLADPSNRSKSRESFAYKQLAFEPFMGGGLVTVGSVIVIYEFGLMVALIASVVIGAFWLAVGLWLGRRRTA